MIARSAARRALLCLALLLPAPPAAARRIVAIGDIHGDAEALVSILSSAGLVDGNGHWSGGATTLVQVGDILDRGPRQRLAMDVLRRLQREAPASGGEVIVLLGNHEALQLLQERRDLGAETLVEFAAESSEAARRKEADDLSRVAKRARSILGHAVDFDRKSWLEANPPGLLPFLAALSPEGEYGAWLRGLPAVARVDDTVFVHGGLTPEVAAKPIEEINERVREEIRSADACRALLLDRDLLALSSTASELIETGTALLARLRERRDGRRGLDPEDAAALDVLTRCEPFRDWYLLHADGPLWFRGYAADAPNGKGWQDGPEGLAQAERTLAALGAEHIVVGHTPRLPAARIQSRFGNALILIDTGMLSSFYQGRASALEIEDGSFRAIYTEGSEALVDPASPSSAGGSGGASGSGSRTGAASVVLAALSAELRAPDPGAWSWMGPDGPLPFDEDELLLFLQKGEIVDSKPLTTGINRPLRLEIEQDGVQARAVFRNVEQEWRNEAGPGGRFFRYLRDSYIYECAAYELSRRLGLDRVPPTTLRVYRGKQGSIQAWVEDAFMEEEVLRGRVSPPDPTDYGRQLVQRKIFDVLVNNLDRNAGNTLIDANWRTWWIDHSRTFLGDPDPKRIHELERGERRIVDAMRTLDRKSTLEALRPYLSGNERRALERRWSAILKRFDELVAERGEDVVFFNY